MKQKYLGYLIILLAVAVIVPQVALAAWWNPFSWNWGRLNSVFHFQQTTQKQEQQNKPPVVGGDRDAHGCIGSAGYTWCEAKQKCLRQWEEPCNAILKQIKIVAPIRPLSNINLDARYVDAKITPGNNAIRVKLSDNTFFHSTCSGPNGVGLGDGSNDFYELNKSWVGPSWWFNVNGPESDDGSVIFANEISCIAQ